MSFPIYGIKDFETAIWQRFISTLALREKERETLLGTRREDLPLVSFSTGLSSVVSPPDAIWEELYYFFSIFFICLSADGCWWLGLPSYDCGWEWVMEPRSRDADSPEGSEYSPLPHRPASASVWSCQEVALWFMYQAARIPLITRVSKCKSVG